MMFPAVQQVPGPWVDRRTLPTASLPLVRSPPLSGQNDSPLAQAPAPARQPEESRSVTLQPCQTLSHYRLVEKIGEGGMGVVWEARETKLDRNVAVKIFLDEFAQDWQRLARLKREAKLLAVLHHPQPGHGM